MGQETREVLLKKRDHVNFNIDKALANGICYLIDGLIIPHVDFMYDNRQ